MDHAWFGPFCASARNGGETPVLLYHRHACFDALVTDIYGRAGDKPANLVGAFAAERTAQS
jgi:hypothetical protein